jgi:hypothetical protein
LDVVPAESDTAFQVSFQDDGPQFSLRIQHFGGCAAYLRAWSDLERRADALDAAVMAGADADEPRLFLSALVESVIGQLFVGTDCQSGPVVVKGTTRVRVSKPQQ